MTMYRKLSIEKGAVNSKLAKGISAHFSRKEIQIIESAAALYEGSIDKDKKSLCLAKLKGSAVKEFRRMDGLVQKKEYYIVFGQNCPYDCQYCFLQCYTDNAIPTLYVNQNKILNDVHKILKEDESPFFYTGEITDSLIYDRLTDFNAKLINLFSRYPNATLELRTKCVDIEKILKSEPIPNLILSWTFSPQKIINTYEKRTPPLASRIKAAKKCQESGFKIGLRFDPIIACEDWEKEYNDMMDEIFNSLDSRLIDSAVLGVFRYHPSLAKIIRERFPKSDITINEFVPCIDGKMRYFKPLRAKIYSELVRYIRSHSRNLKITLCMETLEIWEAINKKQY